MRGGRSGRSDSFAGVFKEDSGWSRRMTSPEESPVADIATHMAGGGEALIGTGVALEPDRSEALLSRRIPIQTTAPDALVGDADIIPAGSEVEFLLRRSPAPSLSVVMPAHNERHTIRAAVEQVLSLEVPWLLELIVVDDGSTDTTPLVLDTFDDDRLRIVRHLVNRGKGHAVRSGAALARGTHLAVFDADCEYSASDLVRMFKVVLSGQADIVYGTRDFDSSGSQGPLHYQLGRRLTTAATNVLFSAQLSDLHTCLKMMPLDVFRSLELSEGGFGLDTEITAELLRRGHILHEVSVSYMGRSRADGKKISWRDGVVCLRVLANVRRRGHYPIYVDLSGEDQDLTEMPQSTPHNSMAY